MRAVSIASLFLIVLAVGTTHSAWAETEKTVVMKSISYDPKILAIEAGDAVVWVNHSYTEHSATAEDGAFDTKLIAPKASTKAVRFSKPGSYKYHCSMHGKSMSGVINVSAKSK